MSLFNNVHDAEYWENLSLFHERERDYWIKKHEQAVELYVGTLSKLNEAEEELERLKESNLVLVSVIENLRYKLELKERKGW
jgi:hypothetical protein